jgi:uncharacterized membrane protein YtjA (UPF0391 family)
MPPAQPERLGEEQIPPCLVLDANPFVKGTAMLKWALIFFVVSLVTGFLGFSGVSAATATIARVLFAIAVVVFLVFVVLAFMAGSAVL